MTTTTYDSDEPAGEGQPFDPTNRAWRRFTTIIEEHLDTMVWLRSSDERPILVTLKDLTSGDLVTLAVIDSAEDRRPHLLLTLDINGELTTHGPFNGPGAAAAHAGSIALDTARLYASRPVPLLPPDRPVPNDAWMVLPDDDIDVLHTAPPNADAPAAVILIDPAEKTFTTVGPFTDPGHAAAWQQHVIDNVIRHTVTLHPASTESSNATGERDTSARPESGHPGKCVTTTPAVNTVVDPPNQQQQ